MKALNAVGVWRGYGAQEVLKGLDLSLEPGAFEALMGPSGCGKSTFLHIAAGLLAVDRGTVEIGGQDITKMGDSAAAKFRRRHLGVVFQSLNLLGEKTVFENVLMPLVLDGASTKDEKTRQRYSLLMEKLGISGMDGKRPSELSGGERQRVAIARALMAEPDVILADEPTGNLDTASAKDFCDIVGEVNRTERSAILLVTHDPQVAAKAHRVHFLRDGAIAATFDTQNDPAHVSQRYLETYR